MFCRRARSRAAAAGRARILARGNVFREPAKRPQARATRASRNRNRHWCERRDSNPHARRHWNLNPARLPVPPLSHAAAAVREDISEKNCILLLLYCFRSRENQSAVCHTTTRTARRSAVPCPQGVLRSAPRSTRVCGSWWMITSAPGYSATRCRATASAIAWAASSGVWSAISIWHWMK